MGWTQLNFGKYKGKTLPQIVFADPDWFFWAWEDGVFANRSLYMSEAQKIHRRATNIRVPQRGPEKLVVEYTIHPSSGALAKAEIVPESRPPHMGASPTHCRDVIDLSVPRQIATYDKTGGKLLVKLIKEHILGGSKKRLTKKICEEFFDNIANFWV
ncbi:MAG: hypothetical protein ACLQPD_12110 [Desulfomonilaceae bacterium]